MTTDWHTPNGYGALSPFGGIQIVEDANMLDWSEDWSGVRSPARARRRRKRGFPQRIRIVATPKKEGYRVGNRIVMHPDLARALREIIRAGVSS